MIQQVLTYLIIACAAGLALWKIYNKLSGKKRRKKIDLKKQTFPMKHNCKECIADCILRDSPAMKRGNSELCETKVVKKAKDS